jgi:hypothetical protein
MRLILWSFCSNSLIMRVIFSSVSAALNDPENDNHQKNQPKNHGWICSVATETRLEIFVSWSDLFSSSGNSPRDFRLLVFTNDVESDYSGRFSFSESDRPGWFRRFIKTRNCSIGWTHACTDPHTCCNYI